MYSAKINSHTFINELSKYIRANDIPVNNTPILDVLLENPDMQRLMSIWLQAQNVGQLNYLLVHTVNSISLMEEAEQSKALNDLLERTQFLNAMIPSPSDLDMVLDSMGEKKREISDGWSDFNLPIAELTPENMKKLQHHVFFINGGVFTANMVAGMTPTETAAFDARVSEIIKAHSDFIYPDRIFSDKLLALLKSDLVIREILGHAKAVESFVILPKHIDTRSDNPTEPAEVTNDLLAQYLGLDDENSLSEISTVDLYNDEDQRVDRDSRENVSALSDATTVQEGDLSAKKDKPLPTPLTFWQQFNIEAHELHELIRIGELHPHEIPDRELTEQEAAIYHFMNRLNEDLKPVQTDTRKQKQVVQPVSANRQEVTSPQSNLSSMTNFDTSSTGTAYEYRPRSAPKQQKTNPKQEKFLTDCKDTSHNKYYQQRNREYKERMQERHNRAYGEDKSNVSNPDLKPKSKF